MSAAAQRDRWCAYTRGRREARHDTLRRRACERPPAAQRCAAWCGCVPPCRIAVASAVVLRCLSAAPATRIWSACKCRHMMSPSRPFAGAKKAHDSLCVGLHVESLAKLGCAAMVQRQ